MYLPIYTIYIHLIILHISENHDNIATVEEENDRMVVFTRTKITVITNGSRERQFHSQKCASNNIFRGFPNSFQKQAKISLCKVINFNTKFFYFRFSSTYVHIIQSFMKKNVKMFCLDAFFDLLMGFLQSKLI